MIAFEVGDHDEVERLIDDGRAANERAGSPAVEVMRLETLGRLDIAELHARDSLERSLQIRHRKGVLGALAALARIARSAGDVERAGLLWVPWRRMSAERRSRGHGSRSVGRSGLG